MDKVTVVATVKNEIDNVSDFLKSLHNQTLKPYEIIIVDGGSNDGTWEVLKKDKKIKSFQILDSSRSMARNFAVKESKGEIIAFTDAGCLADKNWLHNISSPFSNKSINVVSGYYAGLAVNDFQKCLIPYVLVMPDKANSTEFYPSTRSMAIRKNTFINENGFDENLFYNEDFAFANKLKKNGHRFYFAQDAVVNWIPRKNIKQAFKMFFLFALGDIQSGTFRRKVKLLFARYFAWTLGFFFIAELNITLSLIFALISFIAYSMLSVLKNFKYTKSLASIFFLPLLQYLSDIAIIMGSTAGFLMAVQNKRSDK